MKKILITGASGFIGSYLVETALEQNYEVYAGIRSSSRRTYLRDTRIRFFEMDMCHPSILQKQLSTHINEHGNFDYVIHNAGITSASGIHEFYEINYNCTENLCNSLINCNAVPEKFIYISSLAAFGPGHSRDLEPLRHYDTPNPITAYGKSKLMAEKMLMSRKDFPYIIFRPTAVYGPRDKAFLMYFRIIKNFIELYIGRKKQYLSFIFVKDLADVVFRAIESDYVRRSWFVSDGNNYDAIYFAECIKKHLGRSHTIKLKVPETLAKGYAFILEKAALIMKKQPALNREKISELCSVNWKCDSFPMMQELDFYPAYDLERGVKSTAEWYLREGWL